MSTRLRHLWDVLTSSYWFVPTLMVVGAIGLAFALVNFDRTADEKWLEDLRFVYLGGADGARAMLSTVASSVITVAGVVFSITIAALTQASSQFGPRLLRNFMRDRGNQIVLGTFVATFIYCLLVLRTVYGGDERGFVPHVAVTVGTGLAIASLGVLIYFVHHVSSSLQAPMVAANVARELDAAITTTYCAENRSDGGSAADAAAFTLKGESRLVRACRGGYLLAVDEIRLLHRAESNNLVIRMCVRPGNFLTTGRVIADVFCGGQPVDDLDSLIDGGLLVGESRTSEQDVEFTIDQLVEIAVRALSPGINDPFTAVNCVDWLGEGLARIAREPSPSAVRRDGAKRVRLILDRSTFAGLTDAAFDQIRQYGKDSVSVTARLLEAITSVAQSAQTQEQRRSLLRHAEMISAQARNRFTEKHDLQSVQERYMAARTALAQEEAR